MKKLILPSIILLVFIAYSLCVKFCVQITQLDRLIETNIQNILSFIPLKYPVFADKTGYVIMLCSALIIGTVYFIKKKEWLQIPVFLSLPLCAYILNYIIKHIIQRPRPCLDLQISWVHPTSYSFVSTHTLITFCLFSIAIYYFCKNCKNTFIKYFCIALCGLWIFITGLSRIWIGVHYPSDVIGAILLGIVLLYCWVELSKFVERYKQHG